jgi:Fur family ferric uptake transcriptional regulator
MKASAGRQEKQNNPRQQGAGGAGYDAPILASRHRQPADQDSTMNQVEELKSSGLKATLPRIRILEVFQKASVRHMTAEDVFKTLLTEGSDIGLATVYRVLMQFEQAGILSRNHFESGKSVFELNEGHHHDHLVCMSCGRVEEFFDPEIEARQRAVAQARGFSLQEHSLALYATCVKADCAYRGTLKNPGSMPLLADGAQ